MQSHSEVSAGLESTTIATTGIFFTSRGGEMLAIIAIQELTAILTLRSFVLNPPSYIPKNGAMILVPYLHRSPAVMTC
jgi:hypothetical protein